MMYHERSFLAGNVHHTELPVGTVIAYAGDPTTKAFLAANPNWLLCDGTSGGQGASVAVDAYPELYAALGNGTIYGQADQQHFYLPNYSGMFLRGVAQSGGIDPGPRTPATSGGQDFGVGSTQADMVQMHEHAYQQYLTSGSGGEAADTVALNQDLPSPPHTTSLYDGSGNELSGAETRPVNIYVHFLIKAASLNAVAGAALWGGALP
jgi:microcystin-dependent protein